MSEQEVFDLYRSLKLWTNPTCTHCKLSVKPDLFGPVGIWQVGKSYSDDPYRVVFIGKNARGDVIDNAAHELAQQGFIDVTSEADKYIGETWVRTGAILQQLSKRYLVISTMVGRE